MTPAPVPMSNGQLPSLVARWMNRLTAPKSAPPPALRFHRWLYIHTDGRLGAGLIGAWTLLLRTRGRRSGELRTAALVFAQDGGRLVVAASNDGRDTAPAWLHNLRADPQVEVQVGRHRMRGRASVLQPSDPDYARLWQLMNATNNGRYDAHQAKTARPIPLVVIEPD